MSHAQIGRREEVDSRLLVVGSQIASLTPGPSFAHNLGCRCPNRQCEGIFDIYVSRPFQWHQEHPNARCFSPCCRALNIRESRKTPNLQLFQVLGFTPTLGQSGVTTMGCRDGQDHQQFQHKGGWDSFFIFESQIKWIYWWPLGVVNCGNFICTISNEVCKCERIFGRLQQHLMHDLAMPCPVE